jgi:hypothetical protein
MVKRGHRGHLEPLLPASQTYIERKQTTKPLLRRVGRTLGNDGLMMHVLENATCVATSLGRFCKWTPVLFFCITFYLYTQTIICASRLRTNSANKLTTFHKHKHNVNCF